MAPAFGCVCSSLTAEVFILPRSHFSPRHDGQRNLQIPVLREPLLRKFWCLRSILTCGTQYVTCERTLLVFLPPVSPGSCLTCESYRSCGSHAAPRDYRAKAPAQEALACVFLEAASYWRPLSRSCVFSRRSGALRLCDLLCLFFGVLLL